MSSFRYERSEDGLGLLVSDLTSGGDGAGLAAAGQQELDRLIGEADGLKGIILGPIPGTLTEADFERLEATELPVVAVLAKDASARSVMLSLRCTHRIFVEGTRFQLDRGSIALPLLDERPGLSAAEARAAGLIDEVTSDLASAMAAARRWALAGPGRRGTGAGTIASGLTQVLGNCATRSLAGVDAVQGGMNARFAGRVFGSFLVEGLTLLGDGVPAEDIEQYALDAGLAMGPLAATDLVGLAPIDEALHAALDGHDHAHHDHAHHDHAHHDHAHHDHSHHDHTHHDHGHAHAHDDHAHHHHAHHDHHHCCGHEHHHGTALDPIALPKSAVYVVEKMAHGLKRTGWATGGGFYVYEDDQPSGLWSGLSSFRRRAAQVPPEDIRDRLLFAMALEARRSLGALDVDSRRLGDVVSLYGCGFPLALGGAISFGSGASAGAFAGRARQLAAKYGERFQPPVDDADHSDPSHGHEHAH